MKTKRMNKILSLLLSCIMVLGLVAVPTMAGEPAENVLFADDFEEHGAVGTKLTTDNTEWSTVSGAGDVAKDIEIAADPTDASNKVAKFWFNNKTGSISLQKRITGESIDEPIIVKGRIMLPEVPKGKVTVYLKGSKQANLIYIRDSDAQVRPGGVYVGSFGKARAGEWISFTCVLEPNTTDWSKAPNTVFVSGGTTSSNDSSSVKNNPLTYSTTVDLKSTTSTHEPILILEYTPVADTSGAVYFDDIELIKGGTSAISPEKATNVPLLDPVKINFSVPVDMTTFNEKSVTVTTNTGATVAANVVYDPRVNDSFTLNLEEGWGATTSYIVSLSSSVKDVLGNSITNTANFTTGDSSTLVYDDITAISITYDGEIEQEETAVSKVTFTALTTPATNVDYSKIEWLVDGVVMGSGKKFEYTPEASVGDYVITARSADDNTVSATQTVSVMEVVPVHATGITVLPETLDIWLDYPYDITPRAWFAPEDATNKNVTWVSSDPSVATVDPKTGSVTMLKVGKTTITATAVDGGYTDSMELTVTEAINRGENQKMNLDPVQNGQARIDVDDFLGLPENVGEGRIALWSGDKTAAFTSTADDSIVEDFKKWAAWNRGKVEGDGLGDDKYHTAYGIPTTLFVPQQNFVPGQSTGTYYSKNSAKWVEAANAGLSVQSHSTFHINGDVKNETFTTALHLDDCKDSVTLINEFTAGTGNECRTFAVPWGGGIEEIWREIFIAARYSGGGVNNPGTTDYNRVDSLSMNSTRTPSALKQRVDSVLNPTASSYGGWFCIHSHGLDYTAQENTDIQKELGLASSSVYTSDVIYYLFDRLIYPNIDKFWASTFDNVAMYAQERDTAKLIVNANTDTYIKYTLTDEMYDKMFDYPLTIKFQVPSDWTDVEATQNGAKLDLTEKTVEGKKYVFVETVPDRGEVTLASKGTVIEDEVVYGDATGDGTVNALDRAYLSRFLAKWNSYTTLGDEKAADTNGDGTVNALDRAYLSRFLAKWNGYETLPKK